MDVIGGVLRMDVDADNDPAAGGTNSDVEARGGDIAGIIDKAQSGMGGGELSQQLARAVRGHAIRDDDLESLGEILGEE